MTSPPENDLPTGNGFEGEQSYYLLTPWQSGVTAPAVGNTISPTGLSLDGSSPSMTWRPDEFTLNQGYQEYREELRSLIFHTAQSTGPTRQGSPVDDEPQDPDLRAYLDEEHRRETAGILATEGRIKYLRNYVDQVAPWVYIISPPKYSFSVNKEILT